MSYDFSVLILAAGKGTRMRSNKAKVLHTLGGIPLVAHPVHLTQPLQPERIVIIVGHQANQVCASLDQRFGDGTLQYATQHQQLGTGHAVLSGKDALAGGASQVLILSGDVPLLSQTTLKRLLTEKKQANATVAMLSFQTDDTKGYGRILRNEDRNVTKIQEDRDCTPEQKNIKECNAGIYLVDHSFLFDALERVGTNNDQGEYYLTDIVELAHTENKRVISLIVDDLAEVLGVNDRAQLADLEQRWQLQRNQEIMRTGVTMRLPHTTFIEFDVTIGQDTEIEPGCVLRGKTNIGERCHIGSGSHLHNTTIPNETKIQPQSVLRKP